MDIQQMLKLRREGIDPLDISIMKWEDIKDRKGIDKEMDNCALCDEHNYFNEDEHDYDCGACPVRRATEMHGCKGTPYSAWARHHIKNHGLYPRKVRCTECAEIAQKEIDFLKSLKVDI